MLMCAYFGCHVAETPCAKECDCTKCNVLGDKGHDTCASFMAQARRSAWFTLAAQKKCDTCKQAGKTNAGS